MDFENIPIQIGQITLIIIIVLLSIKEILEILSYVGLMPRFMMNRQHQQRKQDVRLILDELGLKDLKASYEEFSQKLRFRGFVSTQDYKELINQFIRKYTREIDTAVGTLAKTKLKYYIDFMDATSNMDDCELMAGILAKFISDLPPVNPPLVFEKIAIPRRGNPHLGILLAKVLRKPCVIVGQGILAEDTFSGTVNPGERFLIVEDIITSGTTIEETVALLRNAGCSVNHSCVLIERTDRKRANKATPSELLAQRSIAVHAVLSINDINIEKILKNK